MAWALTNGAAYIQANFQGIPALSANAINAPAGATASQADLTVASAAITDSTIVNLSVKLTSFRVVVYLKTSAGTGSLAVGLQVSNSATFAVATDIYTLDSRYIDILLTTQQANLILFGMSPVPTGFQYMRTHFSTGAGTSGTADLLYFAA